MARNAAMIGAAVQANGLHIAIPDGLAETVIASWAAAEGGAPIGSQQVVSCSASEWAKIKDEPRFAGWHVFLFAAGVFALGPIVPS